jgi:hypothetical protein
MRRSHGSEATLLLPPPSALQPSAPVLAGDFPGAERSLEVAVREAVTAVLLQYYPGESGFLSAAGYTSREIERRLEDRGGWDEV